MQVLWLLLLLGVTQACFILLCHIVTALFFFFNKLKVGGNSVSNCHLPTNMCSLCVSVLLW